MKTYDELMAEAKALEQQANELRTAERAGTIASIHATMAAQGITLDMLKKAKRPKAPAKYANLAGETWSGVGRRPAWVNAVLASGGSIEAYRVS